MALVGVADVVDVVDVVVARLYRSDWVCSSVG